MDSRWLGVIVLVIILGMGGWYVFAHPVSNGPVPIVETPVMTEPLATTTDAVPAGLVTVMYTANGFSPASVTITEGRTVKWTNETLGEMWIASAMHPTHTAYDSSTKDAHCVAGYAGPLPFDQCSSVAPGASYSFTFTKAGTWKYHDHVTSSMFGTVVVTAVPAAGGTGVTASTSVDVQL